MKLLHFFILAIIGIFLTTSCTGQHQGDGGITQSSTSSTAVSAQSLEAFSNYLYAFGQTQGCVMCHSATVNPQWMNADVNLAYSFARPLVDFNNPTVSVFATFVGNNHCSNPICANPANVPVMQNLLAEWAAVEVQQGDTVNSGSTLASPPFVTQTMAIPSPLPLLTSGTVAVVRFDLSQLTPAVPALNGAFLEISIQAYNSAASEYKVFNPRIAGNSAPITISGIHVYVRPATGSGIGTEDVNQGDFWSGLNITAPVQALPNPLPVGPMTSVTPLVNYSLGIASQSSADVLTIGFAAIQ